MFVSMSQARQMVSLLDLTNLADNAAVADIESLCARAGGPHGPVAAVCVFSRFLPQARGALAKNGLADVRLATVANFPGGDPDAAPVVAEIRSCLDRGADEVDVVLPYKAFLAGQVRTVREFLVACRAACAGRCLKVILETGVLAEPALIRAASLLAVECGADFLKTSTGKVAVHATPEAARIMLEVIASQGGRVGFKASGGLKSAVQAQSYVDLAGAILGPDWVSPATFRLGASGLLDDLLAILNSSPDPCAASV